MSDNDVVIMACQASASGPRQDESDAWCVAMVDFTSCLVVFKAPNKGCIICVSIYIIYIYTLSTETLYSVYIYILMIIYVYIYIYMYICIFLVYLVSQGIDF